MITRVFDLICSEYEAGLREVCCVNCIEEFWGVYNNLVTVGTLPPNGNMHFFKKSIKPAWEDDRNKAGGKWVFVSTYKDIDVTSCWLHIVCDGKYFSYCIQLIALIGDDFENSDDICGVVFSKRKNGDKIALWTDDKNKESSIFSHGYVLCCGKIA